MACERPYAIGNAVFSCYRCKPCLISMSEYWRDRQDLEYQYTRDILGRGSSFITLTYAPAFLPTVTWSEEDEDGQRKMIHAATGVLHRPHLRRFIQTLNQRLLRHGGHKVRYAAVGEYGTEGERPHFHLICYGYAPVDKVGAYAFSEHVHAAWGKGRTDIGPVLKGGSHYISGYITGPRSVAGHPSLQGRPPEFSSRSPALGGGAVDEYAKTFSDTPYASSIDEGVSKPVIIRTEFREVWLRKSLLNRFFTRLGFADPADAKPVEEIQVLAPAEAFVLDRECEAVYVPRTILARANMLKAWDGTRILASRRLSMLEEADGPSEDGGNRNFVETTSDYHRELYGERTAQLVAANAAYQEQRNQRSPF